MDWATIQRKGSAELTQLHFYFLGLKACSEGLGTSFTTDMRSVGQVRARGFLIQPCLLS